MIKKFIVLFALVVITSCSNAGELKPQISNLPEKTYPPIAITINDGYVESRLECGAGYTCVPIVDQTSYLFIDQIRQSKIFERVDTNNAYSEYAISASIARQSKESSVSGIGKILVSSASLFVIPMTYEAEMHAVFDIRHKGQIIKNYEYKIKDDYNAFLLKDPDNDKRETINHLANLFLNDIINDGVFEGKITPQKAEGSQATSKPEENQDSPQKVIYQEVVE